MSQNIRIRAGDHQADPSRHALDEGESDGQPQAQGGQILKQMRVSNQESASFGAAPLDAVSFVE
jgi:hypothetical protein